MAHSKRRYGILFIVSGPSGAGKSTVCKTVMEKLDIEFSVSCTTRAPRAGEIDGKDYYFIDRESFEEHTTKGKFIEHAEVHGNSYGTLRSHITETIEFGKDLLLDIDIQGAMQIKSSLQSEPLLKSCSEFIFIVPPTFTILEQRLRNRSTETEEAIVRRLDVAKTEMQYWHKYDYLIINDKLDKTISDMTSLFEALRMKTKRIREAGFYGDK